MLTFRPDGACRLFDACNYKHFVPTGLAVRRKDDFQQTLRAYLQTHRWF